MRQSALRRVLSLVSLATVLPVWAAPTLTTLATFDRVLNLNATPPRAGVIADAAGNLYGTTEYGGATNLNNGAGYGTVFEIAAGTHTLTTLVTFNGTNGANPYSGVISDAAGNLYGTTPSGGQGTVFRVAAGTHALTTLAKFTGANGAYPRAGLAADAAGNLYGLTENGAAFDFNGEVFQVAAGTNVLTGLAAFTGNIGPLLVSGLTADAAGNLYGTTIQGGAQGFGNVFKVAAGTHAITTLASFDGANGRSPSSGMIADAAGNLYGTTKAGGARNLNNGSGFGTVFKLAAGTDTLTALASFNNVNGVSPEGGVIADAAGNLYGTTQYGGVIGYGTVFKVDVGTGAITSLVSFDNINGAEPQAGLFADAAGNLFGTTSGDGSSTFPTVFELTDTGFVVPEPACLSLLALIALPLLRRHTLRTSTGGNAAEHDAFPRPD